MPAAALGLSEYRGSGVGSRIELSDDEDPGASLGWTEGESVHDAPFDRHRPHVGQGVECSPEVTSLLRREGAAYVLPYCDAGKSVSC
jgi:hypothetical protein